MAQDSDETAPVRGQERLLLCLFDCDGAESLVAWLGGLTPRAATAVEEVVVMLAAPDDAFPLPESLPGGYRVRLHRPPRPLSHGALRKSAFEYALAGRYGLVACASAGGEHPPEALEPLLAPALGGGARVVVGTPASGLAGARRAGAGLLPFVLARLFAFAQNLVLGLSLRDYHSSLRVYAAGVLSAVPFHFDDDGPLFEVHALLQCRALGLEVVEVPVEATLHGALGRGHRLAASIAALGAALTYRLHQLHLLRRGRFFVDLGVHYTLKSSPYSSHMQIVDAIEPGSQVLDLGCSQGLLARPLADKGVRVVGVDAGEQEHIAAELAAYHRHDLETPLSLPHGRDFDYVVAADVIEHIIHRNVLLRSVRRYLKPEGRALISTPNIAIWFYRLSLLIGRFEYGPRGILDYTHVHLFTRDSFRREVEAAGFRVVGERVTALPFEVVFESTGRSRLVRALSGAYHLLCRLWPEMFAYQFVLEVEILTLDDDATLPPPPL